MLWWADHACLDPIYAKFDQIPRNVRGFCPLFLFANNVLLCFVYAVNTEALVTCETLNSSVFFVTGVSGLKDHIFRRSLAVIVVE